MEQLRHNQSNGISSGGSVRTDKFPWAFAWGYLLYAEMNMKLHWGVLGGEGGAYVLIQETGLSERDWNCLVVDVRRSQY